MFIPNSAGMGVQADFPETCSQEGKYFKTGES